MRQFVHYRSGFGTHYRDEWLEIFAAEERKVKNPVFRYWKKGDEFDHEQREALDQYWEAIVLDSERNYKTWKVLKSKSAAKEKVTEAWQRVGIRPLTQPSKENRKKFVQTGLWKSGCDGPKGVTEGIAPASGKSGGLEYEDTLRPTIGKIPPMPKADLLLIVAERLGMDPVNVADKFQHDWRAKSRNLFHHHGGGVWSTVQSEFTGRGKVTAEQLDKLREKAKESKRRSKPQTERQEQFWVLFGDLPPSLTNHDEHDACEVWQHVNSDPKRLETLLEIQSNADSPKVKGMSPADYCYYLQRNLNNFIRHDLFLPYFSVGAKKQGKNYYPREWMRNLPKVDGRGFLDEAKKIGFKMFDATHITNLATKNGDAVFGHKIENGYIIEKNISLEGADTIADREFEKVRQNFVNAVSSSLTNLRWLPQPKRDAIRKLTAELVERDGCINRVKFYYAVSKETQLHMSDVQHIVDHLEDCAKRYDHLKFKDPELTDEQKRKSELMGKLFALAEKTVENGCTQAEADAAASKVDELLDKHGIDRQWFWRLRELQTMQSRSTNKLEDKDAA